MGMYPAYKSAFTAPRGTHGTRSRFPEQLAGIATEMAPWACIRLAERLYGPLKDAQSLFGRTRKDRNGNGTIGIYSPCKAPLRPPRVAFDAQSLPGRTCENGDGTMGMYPPCKSVFTAPPPRSAWDAQSLFAGIAMEMVPWACIRLAELF